ASLVYTPLLKLLYPLVWVVNGIANALLRLLGVTPDDAEGNVLSKEELRTVVMEAGAMIPKKHQKMLLSILDLEKVEVEDIMVPRNEIDGIDLQEPLDEITRELHNSQYTRLPVFDDGIDNIVGLIHVRQAMHALSRGELDKQTIRAICDPPYFIPEGTPLNTQLLNFQRKKRRTGLVVDEYGDVLGLVTMADLLEEIVGEFTTDPSDSVQDAQPQEDGSYLVSGSANVKDLVRTLHWELPTDGPRTLNGLIIEYLEAIPEPGTSLLLGGYPIEILQTQGNAVRMVRIAPQARRTPQSG
ncbi:MAG: magnesium/cobalt efflux protein, partial [Candidatus Sedimenticola endophacoides]